MFGVALRIRRTSTAIGSEYGAYTCTVAFAERTFIVRIRIRRNDVARSIVAAAFFRGAAGMTRRSTSRIATKAIDAIVRCAISTGRTCRAIGGSHARARPIAGESAFIIWIGVVGNDAANAILTIALFRRGAGITCSGAIIAAANTIDTE